ncbi:hypothetical protein Rsub_07194 [Raphidocelis subcapitata]|uniref:Rhodanese domain-containing protein n=1 Tax=Raphidocelis subcapitata TaxID=307507 RepID=A0A2V0P948_9CHLO|nr:hypothetical protein Rsub_07194 [Raphidocelis subcapitata]|eukprot:GBF94380.1 hypothetical protein Rsub_07194 [Raphidocelis subcapitata]
MRPASPLLPPPVLAAPLLAAALLLLTPVAFAHRPLLSGLSGGAQHSTWEAAVLVPWVTSSWSAKRVVECDAPFFWMKFPSEKAGQQVHITAGTPAASGLASTRVGLALIGPGLPKFNASALAFPVPPGADMGLLRISSPEDQSNCDFLQNKVSREFYKPADFPGVGRRCAYYEPHSKSNLWITADANVTLPVGNATYYLVSFLDGRRSTGRFTVAVADWAESEDFARPYALPAGARNATGADAASAAACCGGGGAAAAAGGDLSACPLFSAFGASCPAKTGRERSLLAPAPARAEAPAVAARLMQQAIPYIDVQTPEEFKAASVPGAVNIPLQLPGPDGKPRDNPDFLDQVSKLFPRCSALLVGCRTGVRSARAAALLAPHFADVISVDGGIVGWQQAGLPVRQGG